MLGVYTPGLVVRMEDDCIITLSIMQIFYNTTLIIDYVINSHVPGLPEPGTAI